MAIDDKDKGKQLGEGMIKKGGLNPEPSAPRPIEPPRGQASEESQGGEKD